MKVVDAHRRRVLDEARRHVRRGLWAAPTQTALVGGFLALVYGGAGPLDGLAAMLAAVAVGAMAIKAGRSWSELAGAWRELRRLQANDEYLAAVVEVVAAEDRAELARLDGRTGHSAGAS